MNDARQLDMLEQYKQYTDLALDAVLEEDLTTARISLKAMAESLNYRIQDLKDR